MHRHRGDRGGRTGAAAWCAACLVLLAAPGAQPHVLADDDNPDVIRVEEDWAMDLVEPEGELCTPQFHTMMSPSSQTTPLCFQTTWNYRELPDFTAGGLQLQAWSGESALVSKSVGSTSLSNSAETVKWTQVLKANGTSVSFQIKDGQSSTWGSFGGESMTISTGGVYSNLNGYSAGLSRSNSWISFGRNRVKLLVIKQVRKYGAEGLISVDSTPKVVFKAPD